MARAVSIFIDKFASDDSFLVTLTFSDRILVQKIVSIKTREEEAESSTWKPPLFLIGIAIAFIYQVFFRQSMRKSSTALGRKFNKKTLSSELSHLTKLGKKLNK